MSCQSSDRGLRHEQNSAALTLVRDPFHTPAAVYILSDVWCLCHLAWYVWTWATTQGTLGSYPRQYRLRYGNEE